MKATVITDAKAITWSIQLRVGVQGTGYLEAPPVFRVLADMLKDGVPAKGLLDLNAAGGVVGYLLDIALDTGDAEPGEIPPSLHAGNLRQRGLELVKQYGIAEYVQHVSLHARVCPPREEKK